MEVRISFDLEALIIMKASNVRVSFEYILCAFPLRFLYSPPPLLSFRETSIRRIITYRINVTPFRTFRFGNFILFHYTVSGRPYFGKEKCGAV